MSEKLGKYEVQDRLGRGGMAEVYRAYHPNLDRYVAIKILHAFLAEDEEFQSRFEKEARNIAKLRHPHIVQVYDFDYAPARESYYMVMELIGGVTLKDRLFDLASQGEKPSVEETLRIIREAASALAYAHNRGMIHRDVKPANLMIDTENRVVLTDFGIAKMLDSKQLTVSGGMIGTPAYMSPEQGLGEPGDERSDLYSLGVIMYQLLAGDLPYDAETALGVILMHVNDPVPDVMTLNSDVIPAVKAIVDRAMAKDPEQRYQTAEELIEDIEKVERGESVSPFILEDRPTPPPDENIFAPQETINDDAKVAAPVDQTQVLADKVQQPEKSGSNVVITLISTMVVLAILGGGYFYGVNQGLLPPVAAIAGNVASATSTSTQTVTLTPTVEPTNTETPTPTETPNLLGSATAAAQIIRTQTASAVSPTETNTPDLAPTDTPTVQATDTVEPTTVAMVAQTEDTSATTAAEQTATMETCVFDYAIVEQVPADGEDGGFFRVNEPYERDITLLNTGDCDWGENTSLTFVRGEDFDAGPRVFIRESVKVGEEYTLNFAGTAPARGSVSPIVGTWQLRTRNQQPIGAPIDIAVMVFDPGN